MAQASWPLTTSDVSPVRVTASSNSRHSQSKLVGSLLLDATCRSGKFGDVVSDALFDSAIQARCIVPPMPGVSPGQTVELTMANYGEDWSGPDLLSDYSPT